MTALVSLCLAGCGGGAPENTDIDFARQCARLVPTAGGEQAPPVPVDEAEHVSATQARHSGCSEPGALLVRNATLSTLDAQLVLEREAVRVILGPGDEGYLRALGGTEYPFQIFEHGALRVADNVMVPCRRALVVQIR